MIIAAFARIVALLARAMNGALRVLRGDDAPSSSIGMPRMMS